MNELNDKLIEQVRRWLTRTIYEFSHTNMATRSGEAFEQWHEDKAKDLLTFVNMPEAERELATKELNVGSCNPRRKNLCK